MQIKRVSLPNNYTISRSMPVIDYSDCYIAEFHTRAAVNITDCVRFLLMNDPKWVTFLVKVRDILVVPFGLKKVPDEDNSKNPNVEITKGGKVSVFDVLGSNEQEVLFGYTDKHLDACFSINLQNIAGNYEVAFSTTVKYHNLTGRVYFFLIRPFHKAIVVTSLNRMIQHYTHSK